MFWWFTKLSTKAQYLSSLGLLLVGMVPMAICAAFGISMSIWLMLPCILLMAMGSSMAYVIRAINS